MPEDPPRRYAFPQIGRTKSVEAEHISDASQKLRIRTESPSSLHRRMLKQPGMLCR